MIAVSNSCKNACNSDTLKYKEYISAPIGEKFVTGETIELPENTSEISNIKIKGDISQNHYVSTQLFDINNPTRSYTELTIDEDDWITIEYDNTNGSSIKYIFVYTKNSDLIEDFTNYSLVTEIANVSGTGAINVNNATISRFSTFCDYDFSELESGDKKIKIITSKENKSSIDKLLATYVSFGVGKKGSIKFRLSIIKDLTVTPETFEYSPFIGGRDIPNPDYPVPINVITGDITITSQKGSNSSNLVYHLGNNYLTKWDYIENGIIHKYTNKIDSYNGEEITTDYYSTTGGLDSGATIYYRTVDVELIEIQQSGSVEVYGNNTIITNNINTEMTVTCETNEIIEIKGKLSATAFNDKNFIGTFNLKSLTFETENDIDFKEKEFEYYKQINDESFKIGTFITTEIEDSDTNETVKVVAMDYGLKFATPYATALDYDSGNITMQDVLNEILTNVGVELATDSQPLVNGNFIVDSNQFVNSEVYGDVISAIAGINGMFAIITHDDKLKLLTKNDIEYSEMSEVETEIEMTSTRIYSETSRMRLYENLVTQESINFELFPVLPSMNKTIIVDDIKYKTDSLYPKTELFFAESSNGLTLLGYYTIANEKEYLEEYGAQLGKYKIDFDNSRLIKPDGSYILPTIDEHGTQEVTIDFNRCNFIMYDTKQILYEPIDDANYQKYVNKYFGGDESIADDTYYPRQEININLYNVSNQIVTKPEIIEDYIELDDKRDTRPITIVQLGMSQVQGVEVQARWEEGIQQYGEHYLILNDNPFAYTMEKRRELASNMLEQVKGLGYSSFESQFAFKPYLQLGDAVKFRNKAGELVDSIVLKIDTDYDNITLSAPSIADATVDYIVNDVERTARRAEIIANQATSDITLISKQVTNIGNTVESNYQQMTENFNNYYTIDQTNEMIINAQSGLTNSFSESGGNNIFRNTGLWFKDNNGYEYWQGDADRISEDNAVNNNAILLKTGSFSQEQDVPNGNYSINFYYQKLVQFADVKVKINDVEYELDSHDVKLFYTGEQNSETLEYITQPIVVNTKKIKIEFISDTDGAVKVYDLMCNKGSARLVYSQNENETTTDTVNISKGITITSTNMETIFRANADGIRILTLTGNVVAYFTDKGLSTKELIVENEAQIVKTLWQEVGDQTWITRI